MLWVALAFHPFDRSDWWLENALLFAGVALLVVTHRVFPLSRVSYTTLFVFLCLHTIGAHYTYAEVPYDELAQLTGHSLNEASAGSATTSTAWCISATACCSRIRSARCSCASRNVRGFWGYFLPLDLTMSTSMLYELIEWGAAAGRRRRSRRRRISARRATCGMRTRTWRWRRSAR